MSGGTLQLFDIILFAAIAGFLLLRLRSVLGRRTGTEKRIDPFAPRPSPPPRPSPFTAPGAAPGPVIEGQATPVTEAPPPAPSKTPGAGAIKAVDPAFDEAAFLKGARGAFEIVVNAFAASDVAALRPLLAPDVLDSFAGAIKARGGAKLPSPLVTIKRAEIVESAVEGMTALVTVKIVSDQNGENHTVEEHVDHWTFSRRLKARDPNWTLIATKTPDAA
ncbi:MAG: Tim44 domain-containing protein [Alphaproteobacteria bacterium]|nr:Tim44 domain-containing protein [Alphaproteobacteria bacterium]MDE2631168.1 Tim44 domain-containing protein [Alphaproteobacteria bacterium]